MTQYFNSKGELNASNVQEALETISKLAAALQNTPSNMALAGDSSISSERMDALVDRAIYSPEGKIALAQAMANPIRRNLDYMGLGRRALVVDPLNKTLWINP